MADRSGRGRRGHLKDFSKDLDGRYYYAGDFYTYEKGQPLSRKALIKRLWLLGAALVVLILLGGSIPAAGMLSSYYQLLPYGIEVGAVGSVLWAIYKLDTNGDPLRSYIYQATIGSLPGRAILVVIAAGLGIAGTLLYLFLHGTDGQLAFTLLYLGLKALTILCSLVIRRLVQRSVWQVAKS